jgi:hypothetical protein
MVFGGNAVEPVSGISVLLPIDTLFYPITPPAITPCRAQHLCRIAKKTPFPMTVEKGAKPDLANPAG